MKKMLIIILIFLAWTAFATLYMCFFDNPKDGNRDTILLLGDGTFQITHASEKNYHLFNVVSGDPIAKFILKYRIIKRNNKIYTIGKDQPNDKDYQYTILNYKTGEYIQYSDINLFKNDERIIFLDEEQFKVPR